jgi:hypothetical protein
MPTIGGSNKPGMNGAMRNTYALPVLSSAMNVVDEMLRRNVDYCVIVDPTSAMHIVGVVNMRDILVYAHRSLRACPGRMNTVLNSFALNNDDSVKVRAPWTHIGHTCVTPVQVTDTLFDATNVMDGETPLSAVAVLDTDGKYVTTISQHSILRYAFNARLNHNSTDMRMLSAITVRWVYY